MTSTEWLLRYLNIMPLAIVLDALLAWVLLYVVRWKGRR